VVPRPLAGINQALVVAGSDKRGTIYGIYELSDRSEYPLVLVGRRSPHHREALYVKPGVYIQGPPAVKYRGILE